MVNIKLKLTLITLAHTKYQTRVVYQFNPSLPLQQFLYRPLPPPLPTKALFLVVRHSQREPSTIFRARKSASIPFSYTRYTVIAPP